MGKKLEWKYQESRLKRPYIIGDLVGKWNPITYLFESEILVTKDNIDTLSKDLDIICQVLLEDNKIVSINGKLYESKIKTH